MEVIIMTKFIYAKKNIQLTALGIVLGFGFAPAVALSACAQTPALDNAQVEQVEQIENEAPQAETQTEEVQTEEAKPAETGDETVNEEATETEIAPAETAPASEGETVTTPTKGEWSANGCYTQADGKVECLCDSEETCKTLQESDVCEPGTEWMTEDKVGGCTQKSDAKE